MMTIEYDDWELDGETVRIFLKGKQIDSAHVKNVITEWLDNLEKLEFYEAVRKLQV